LTIVAALYDAFVVIVVEIADSVDREMIMLQSQRRQRQ
jgi:hypothetical protein